MEWCTNEVYRADRARRGQTALDPRPGSHTWPALPDYATALEPPLNDGFKKDRGHFTPEEWADAFQRIRGANVDVEPIRQKWRA